MYFRVFIGLILSNVIYPAGFILSESLELLFGEGDLNKVSLLCFKLNGMKILCLIPWIIFALLACDSSQSKGVSQGAYFGIRYELKIGNVFSIQQGGQVEPMEIKTVTSPSESINNYKVWLNDSNTYIQFDLLKIRISNYSAYDEISKYSTDTIQIYEDIENSVDQKIVRYSLPDNATDYDSICFFESFRTTLSIPMEGPHLDLYDWRGYESGWFPMKKISAKAFQLKRITRAEQKLFPEFTKAELLQETDKYEEYGGGQWSDQIRNHYTGNWKNSYHIGVGIRRIKVELYKNDQKWVRILEVIIPQGC